MPNFYSQKILQHKKRKKTNFYETFIYTRTVSKADGYLDRYKVYHIIDQKYLIKLSE